MKKNVLEVSQMFEGSLFTTEFLQNAIQDTGEWQSLDDDNNNPYQKFKTIFDEITPKLADFKEDEAVTIQQIITPLLESLGWASLPEQQQGNYRPDSLLFENTQIRENAQNQTDTTERFKKARLIGEFKRWNLPLDRADKEGGLHKNAPSTQILGYLSYFDTRTSGKLIWGILTNGNDWRLYYHKAVARTEGFFNIRLQDMAKADAETQNYWCKIFYLIFSSPSFVQELPLHYYEEGKRWERNLAENLSKLIFDKIFVNLAKGIKCTDAEAKNLENLKNNTLIIMYRILFILYAEDRDLLPRNNETYQNYSLTGMREEIIEKGDNYSSTATSKWQRLNSIFTIIEKGDVDCGIPPYNGGLFSDNVLKGSFTINDKSLMQVIDTLSRHQKKWINYRDLSVQQLGSIYEVLLEHQLYHTDNHTSEQPDLMLIRNSFARKKSGSYYTPEDLVLRVIEETIEPLIDDAWQRFENAKNAERAKTHDVAMKILDLKICDPAMGSGHFLVSLVDYLSARISDILTETLDFCTTPSTSKIFNNYQSPLESDITNLRDEIMAQAKKHGWHVEEKHLEDRHLVRRMVLKRVIHGVDLNPMAVELAKLSLWLHSFTVGAPLSFLDHHLRVGNSLFGEFVGNVLPDFHSDMFLMPIMQQAKSSADGMVKIGRLPDANIDQVKKSAQWFEEVQKATNPLKAFLDFRIALRFFGVHDFAKNRPRVLNVILDGSLIKKYQCQDVTELLQMDFTDKVANVVLDLSPAKKGEKLSDVDNKTLELQALKLIDEVQKLKADLHFFHWQVAFPDIWQQWESVELQGGFDAVISNPPWDTIKIEQVEFFSDYDEDIASQSNKAKREAEIEKLQQANPALYEEYQNTQNLSENMREVARNIGCISYKEVYQKNITAKKAYRLEKYITHDYPLLAGGDTNLYALFVERAHKLLKPTGISGLVVPSGIYGDKSKSDFFGKIASESRLKILYDYENKKQFFPDVHASFKFCIFVTGGRERQFANAKLAFFLRKGEDAPADKGGKIEEKTIILTAEDFILLNPNTKTAPILRDNKTAKILLKLYQNFPILHHDGQVPLYPIKYATLFHMSNDSGLFKTSAELDAQDYYQTAPNLWQKGKDKNFYRPLYEGKSFYHYNHRASGVEALGESLRNQASAIPSTDEKLANPEFYPSPRYWIGQDAINQKWQSPLDWAIAFRDITNATNERTMIASAVPKTGFGHTAPLLLPLNQDEASIAEYQQTMPSLLANLSSFAFDFITRQKIHGTHLNYFVVQQLAVIPPEAYQQKFGTQSAETIIKQHLIQLCYNSHDMQDFAIACGANKNAEPITWNPEARRHLTARLDALYFLLYGIDEEDANFILESFLITKNSEIKTYGDYRLKTLILSYIKALKAGDSTSIIDIA